MSKFHVDSAATPSAKRSRWDATPAPQSSAWDEAEAATPHVPVAMTPIGGYGMTPGAMTPGAGRTPHGSRTPGLGWNATPGAMTPGGRTPGLGYTPKVGGHTSGRWDATPAHGMGHMTPNRGMTPHGARTMTPGAMHGMVTPGTSAAFAGTPYGGTPYQSMHGMMTPGMTPKSSRWDSTPEISGGRTPSGYGGKFGQTPAATPGTVAVGGMMTPALPSATPATPEQFLKIRYILRFNMRQCWIRCDLISLQTRLMNPLCHR